MGQPILEVEHLKKSYVNNVPILDDVSFSMQKGEVVVIVGPSGCGKSTFLRCINRLEGIDSGVLKLDGVSYEKEKKNISKVREKIGMVFQSYDLFPNMTILNNLLLAPLKVQKRNKEEVKKEAEQLLDRVGLLDKKDNYPRQLSGGQKQRLSIARAIAKDPEIVIFDDSFSALDFKTDSQLRKALKEHTKDATTIIVAQRISTILNADQIIVLDDGRMAGIGTHKELMADCEVYQQIARSQLSEEELA